MPCKSYLGQGASGQVRLAIRKSDGKKFAVKILEKSVMDARDYCFKELRILNKCKDQNGIMSFHEYYEDTKNYFIVTEYIEGGDLAKRMETPYSNTHKFTHTEVIEFIKQTAIALSFLHKNGIVHRDLKPSNILLPENHSIKSSKIADFGLSAEIGGQEPSDCDNIRAMTSLVGSPEYMAPEIARLFLLDEEMEMDAYTEKCDIWSLGVIAYKLICGQSPFQAESCYRSHCGWDMGEACSDCSGSLFEQIEMGDLQKRGEEWDELPYEFINLIEDMLTKDDFKRISAEQILSHPAITQDGDLDDTLSNHESIKFVEKDTCAQEYNREFDQEFGLKIHPLPEQPRKYLLKTKSYNSTQASLENSATCFNSSSLQRKYSTPDVFNCVLKHWKHNKTHRKDNVIPCC
jgi:serine/threonine protein kinase